MGLQPNIARKRDFSFKTCSRCGQSFSASNFAPTNQFFIQMAYYLFAMIVPRPFWNRMSLVGLLLIRFVSMPTSPLFLRNGIDCMR